MRPFRLAFAALLALLFLATAAAARVPDFTFNTDRGPLALKSLRGKVVYLDYWASWCGPCRRSFPVMNELQARYGDKGFVIVAVTLDQNVSEARRFLARYPADFIVAYDPDGVTSRALQVRGMPTTFLIDPRGEIAWSHAGFSDADKSKIEREIEALLPAGTTV